MKLNWQETDSEKENFLALEEICHEIFRFSWTVTKALIVIGCYYFNAPTYAQTTYGTTYQSGGTTYGTQTTYGAGGGYQNSYSTTNTYGGVEFKSTTTYDSSGRVHTDYGSSINLNGDND